VSGTTQSANILVVEDDRDLRETFVEALEDEGYNVGEASDGLRALEYLRSSAPKPQLILLDLMMPNMNGFQFREEQLKNVQFAAIPVAVLTAEANAKEKAESLNAAAFMSKPVSMDSLLELVGRLLVSPAPERGRP
jgi:two-component system, chemotaxis family, chemotaxis protein CheY